MARAKQIKVMALVNIKHDKNFYKVNDEFKLKEDEAKELNQRGFVSLLEDVKKDDEEDDNNDDNNDDNDENDGENEK
ncbi:hypothetical protein WG909_13135 [Peptostreptococcaceae bacterium AGR-M142]